MCRDACVPSGRELGKSTSSWLTGYRLLRDRLSGYRLSAIGYRRAWRKTAYFVSVRVADYPICPRLFGMLPRENPVAHVGMSHAPREVMTPQELRRRTTQFAIDVTALVQQFRNEPAADIVIKQLIRSATGTAANYRAAGQARSHAEFTSRISVALEEADECIHWLEFSERAGLAMGSELARLIRESK
ncbi:MAG: four helix bundle protein, partial [Acidobacteria bacterium]